MRFVDEFRDPAAARKLLGAIERLAAAGGGGEHFKFMEVCGGHTHTIYRHGIEHLLPENVELVHGPGCPVCVIPMGRIDDAMWLAEQPGVIFTCFGDMMRVPGSNGSLLDAKARGADVRFVYSPLDALKVAVDNPGKQVVFFAIGFETTAPSTAVTLLRAKELNLQNPLQVVTVASLVQAEGKTHDDFRKMAEVVYNRLKTTNTETNRLLQFDSTFNYLKGQSNIHISESEINSNKDPYNTYTRKGLPPGPIGNPGDDALKATLNPTSDGWVYFVATDGQSNTEFAKTYAEFQKLKDKFNESSGN